MKNIESIKNTEKQMQNFFTSAVKWVEGIACPQNKCKYDTKSNKKVLNELEIVEITCNILSICK